MSEKKRDRREYWAGYYKKNRDRELAGDAAYRERNRDAIRARARKRYAQSADEVKERIRVWRRAHPGYWKPYAAAHREDHNAFERNRRALKRTGGRPISLAEWNAVLERHGRACLRCGSTEKITMDHVVPISRGGKHLTENLQPLCMPCNASKGAKTADFRKVAEHEK